MGKVIHFIKLIDKYEEKKLELSMGEISEENCWLFDEINRKFLNKLYEWMFNHSKPNKNRIVCKRGQTVKLSTVK